MPLGGEQLPGRCYIRRCWSCYPLLITHIGRIQALFRTDSESRATNAQYKAGLLLDSAYCIMIGSLPQIFTYPHGPQLVIALDNADPLTKMSINGFRPSHVLFKAIHYYNHGGVQPIWVVFASTTSLERDFHPPPQVVCKYMIHFTSYCYYASQLFSQLHALSDHWRPVISTIYST